MFAVCVVPRRTRVIGLFAVCRVRSGALVRRRHGHGIWRWQERFLRDGPSGMCRAMCGRGSANYLGDAQPLSVFYKPTFQITLKLLFENQKNYVFATLTLFKSFSQNWPAPMLAFHE